MSNKQQLTIDSAVFDELRKSIDQAITQAICSAMNNQSKGCSVTARIDFGLSRVTNLDDIPADCVTIEWRVSSNTPVKTQHRGGYVPEGTDISTVQYLPAQGAYVIGRLNGQISIDD